MADPTTVKRLRFEDNVQYDTMTFSDWQTNYARYAMFAIEHTDGILYDVTEWISEIQITHNEIDGEGAGRDKKTGQMKRVYVTTKHDLQVKVVDGVPQDIARVIFALVDTNPGNNKYSFVGWYQWPCGGALSPQTFYCSTVNFGAQRYSKSDRKCKYYGMNFKVIQM